MRTLWVTAILAGLSVFAPSVAGADWGPAAEVATLGGTTSGHSTAIVAAASGRFVVGWTAAAGTATTDTRVVAQRLGGGRTGQRLTLASGAGAVNDVRLWPAPNGATVATWATSIGPFTIAIVLRTIGRDDRLGPPVTVTEPGEGGLAVTAVPRPDGSVTVAWIAQTAHAGSVVKARRISATGVAGAVSVISAPGDVIDELVGAADIDDGAMLVWNDRGILYGRRVTAAGAPARPTFQISGLGQTATAPQLATDGTGGATVAWVQQTDPVSVQEVAIISDDKLSGLEQLSEDGVPSLAPSLAFRGLAGVVVWDARTAAGAVVASVDAEGRSVTLSLPSAQTAGLRPRAGIDRAGNGYAVWQRGSDGGWGVQAALFGGRVGATRVTTLSSTSPDPQSPHIAVGPDGRAMAIWTMAATSMFGPALQAAEYTPPRARMSIAHPTATVSRRGRMLLRVACNASDVDRCVGGLRLRHGAVIAERPLRLPKDRLRRIAVRLTPRGRALLARTGRLRLRATVATTQQQTGRVDRLRQTITLRLANLPNPR